MKDKRHYEAICDRGLIKKETTIYDFTKKIREEFFELNKELAVDSFSEPSILRKDTIQEAIDTMKTIENMLIHNGVDIENEIEENILRQQKRAKEYKLKQDGIKHSTNKAKKRSRSNTDRSI